MIKEALEHTLIHNSGNLCWPKAEIFTNYCSPTVKHYVTIHVHFQVLSYAHYFENCNLIKDYIDQLKQTACFNIIKTGKELNIAVLNNITYPWTPPIYIIMSLFIHWSPKGNKRTVRNQEIIPCNILWHLKSQSIAALTKRN